MMDGSCNVIVRLITTRSRFFWTGNSWLPAPPLDLFIGSARLDRVGAPSAFGPGTRDLCQSDGLEEGDNSQLEQGTLLSPPSPANGFPPLPSEHTLLTVCALRVDLFIHPLHCDARSSSPFSHLSCNVSPAAVQDQVLPVASRLQGHPPASSSFWSKWLEFFSGALRGSSFFACGGPRTRDF